MIIILILAFAGFLDAVYLSAKYFLHQEVACSLISGCNEVLGSKFAHIGPIPLALLGVIYYLTLIILAGIYLQTKNPSIKRWVIGIVTLGIIVSVCLVVLQVVIIKAICVYCMISAIITLLLFATSLKLKQSL
jgi:uncharacterized membrane protein